MVYSRARTKQGCKVIKEIRYAVFNAPLILILVDFFYKVELYPTLACLIMIIMARKRSERDTLSRSSMENAITYIHIYIYIYIYIGT